MSIFHVKCDRCDYHEQTESYERAKDLWDSHHTVTGHRPSIDENNLQEGER